MKNILICDQKGGVDKSLIADELAFGFERAGDAGGLCAERLEPLAGKL